MAGIIVGLVIVGAAGAVWAMSSGSDHKPSVAVAAATSSPVTEPVTSAPTVPPPTETPSTQVTRTTNVADLRSVVSQLDATLSQSAAQVGQLKAIIAQFDPGSTPNSAQPCGLSAAAAAAQVQPVIDGRKSIISGLDRLAATATGTERQLVTSLRAAMDLSLQSDFVYQGWMANNPSTDATNPCQRFHDANWQSSQAIAPRASDAKRAFLAAYLPVAARLGVRTDWLYTDF